MYETTSGSCMKQSFTDTINFVRRMNLRCARTYKFFHMDHISSHSFAIIGLHTIYLETSLENLHSHLLTFHQKPMEVYKAILSSYLVSKIHL